MPKLFVSLLFLQTLLPAVILCLSAQDRAVASDTTEARDSLVVRFIPGLGELRATAQTDSSLHAHPLSWGRTPTVGEILARQPGWFFRELGEPGQPIQTIFRSGDWRGMAVLLDGRPMNDPVTGTYNLNDIPVEYIERIEVLTEAEALVVSGNATTSAVNVVTQQYSTSRPISKIRFMQGPFEHTLTDALFTQNVAPGTNLMIGIERHVSDGRFENAALDFWNIRARMRYNASPRLNIALSEFYTSSVMGANGGVWYDSTRSIFEEGLATVRYPGALEDRSRHDLTATAIAKPFDDSLALSHWSIYHSWSERTFRNPVSPDHETEGTFSWQTSGTVFRQHFRWSSISVIAGAQLEHRKLLLSQLLGRRNETAAALFGSGAVSLWDNSRVSVSFRQEQVERVQFFSYGTDLVWTMVESLQLGASYARKARFPNFMEAHWDVVVNFQQPYEIHNELKAGLRFRSSSFTAEATLFHRRIQDAMVFRDLPYGRTIAASLETIPELHAYGATLSSTLRWWNIEARGWVSWTERSPLTAPEVAPSWLAWGEISYHDKLFNEKLEMNAGITARYVGKSDASVYIPSRATFSHYRGARLGQFSTFDLFGVFKIGDAYIDVRYENVPDIRAMTTFAYPLMGRNLKFGVNWRFID